MKKTQDILRERPKSENIEIGYRKYKENYIPVVDRWTISKNSFNDKKIDQYYHICANMNWSNGGGYTINGKFKRLGYVRETCEFCGKKITEEIKNLLAFLGTV